MFKLTKNKIIFLVAALFLGALGGFAAIQNKYHVKKFVKENQFLYDQAIRVARIKNAVFGKTRGQGVALREIVLDRTDWQLEFDASRSLGKYDRFWGNIGFESFKTGVIGGKSRQLFEFIRETNQRTGGVTFGTQAFRYFRAHNLFSNGEPPWGEGLDIYRITPEGKTEYHWELLDQVFDELLAFQFKPIVEFGFMPDALASIPDRRQQWGKGNISPPKDYVEWERLVFETVRHLVQRYGEEELASWYFEVWNEPDLGWLFWIEDSDPKRKPYGDRKEYHKLYDHTARAAKAAFPEIRVGGPASAGADIDKLLEYIFIESADHQSNGTARIDFVSSHGYNFIGFDHRQNMKKSLVSKLFWKLSSCVDHDHENVRAAMARLPFLLTETGPKLKGKDNKNLGRYSAAWYAKMVAGMFYMGDEVGAPYRPREVVLWAAHQVVRNFDIRNGGIATSVKTEDGTKIVKFPIYNAIEALGYLSDERIELTSGSQFGDALHAIATRDNGNSVEILLYHLDEHGNEREHSGPDKVAVRMTIRNLPFTRFEVRQFAVDETHSNSYAVWLKQGRPRSFKRQQYDELVENQDLAEAVPVQPVQLDDTANFEINFEMQTQSLRLITLQNLQ